MHARTGNIGSPARGYKNKGGVVGAGMREWHGVLKASRRTAVACASAGPDHVAAVTIKPVSACIIYTAPLRRFVGIGP
ncbi:hypothetical protein NDU88_004759 [Pleurodeles waltl]|uniref:Uncharacterized protein n=1 Tax=Pleurodeles waltl TaxID=8319 RepID=A0AAV7M783_PLEWA|nr:hypothetical protein NDU88_004759 [Pleurodeles waltl]